MNPFHVYWVRGRDTSGYSVAAFLVSSERWVPDRSGSLVFIKRTDVNVGRESRGDTIHVDPRGHSTKPRIGSREPETVEFTLRLPPAGTALKPGVTWLDTVRAGGRGSGGPSRVPHTYDLTRTMRVTRVVDTLGARALEVVGDGTLHNTDAWWGDSSAGSFGWFDVTGPDHETYLYDPAAGRVLAHRAHFDLRGVGGAPRGAGTDTAAAGLVASDWIRAISRTQAQLALRQLPGPDTSFTFTVTNGAVQGVIFVHTERLLDTATGSIVDAGFGRNDGMVGTVHATYARSRLVAYDALWSDSTLVPVHHRISVRGDTLHLRADAALDTMPLPPVDTTLIAPRPRWAVADYGMLEFLSPLARSFAADTMRHDIAVFRPTPRHWDLGTLAVKPIGHGAAAGLLAVLTFSDDSGPTILVLSPDGTLLYAENSGPTGARRAPKASSHREAEFVALRRQLQHGS